MEAKNDELTTSISNTMTVDKLKKELKKNNIDFASAKRKSDYVDLYISNGLYRHEEKELEEKLEAIGASLPAASLPAASLPAASLPEEIIMSIAIIGHGCEDLLSPWPSQLPISRYFKHNIRVYSQACVPDVNALGNIFRNPDVIDRINKSFSALPTSKTEEIVSIYKHQAKTDYIRNVMASLSGKASDVGFEKLSKTKNLERSSDLTTFLANKNFSFYMDSSTEEVPRPLKQVYTTIGIQVVDIRIKKTNTDGSVSYEQLFSPTDAKYSRLNDWTTFNLIYKNGLTYIIKDVLKRKDLVKSALEIFGFGKKERIIDLSLEQIYNLFQLLDIKYVNIMDFSCRSCSIGRIPEDMSENIYTEEQKYIIKPEAFGKRSDLKCSDLKRSDLKRSDLKRSDLKRSDLKHTKHLKHLKKNKRKSQKVYK
jgi:hypothetical protein